jgi:hypothetical protein
MAGKGRQEHRERPRGVSFRGTVLLGGKTATGIEVPAEVVEQLGSGKRPAVRVKIGAHTYRSTIAVMGGKFMLPVSAENRAGARVEAGDEVEVELTLDVEPRIVPLPDDFAAALDADPRAKETFDRLSPSQKQWHVLSLEGAKTSETRQRRLAKSVSGLREGKPR